MWVLYVFVRRFVVQFFYKYACASLHEGVCYGAFVCLSIFDFLCVHVGVYACQTLLTSPIWVVEDDMSGHCRLVVLEVGGGGRKRG